MQASEQKARRGKQFPLLIFLVCAIPFFAAWILYFIWQPQGRMNYGDLIAAPLAADPELHRLDGGVLRLSQLRSKWILLQIDSGVCLEKCRQKLYYMRQLRLAQGKNQERIERVWLLTDGIVPDSSLLREYAEVIILRAGPGDFLAVFAPPESSAEHIYVIDPLGNLILRFPGNPDPARMLKDLTRLLSVSRIG